MTYGELFLGALLISTQTEQLYKGTILRGVVCPNGQLLQMTLPELLKAYRDLTTWALPINPMVMDQ